MFTMETLTRRRLAQIMKKHNRIKIVDAYNFIDFVIVVVKEALLRGNSVKIRGFGTFLIKHKHARLGRNPHTKESQMIAAHDVVLFRPSINIKKSVNKNIHFISKIIANQKKTTDNVWYELTLQINGLANLHKQFNQAEFV